MRALYTFFRSSTSYRVRIALSVKGLEWEPRFVSLPKMEHRDSAYLDVNPQGLVPALVEEDGHVLAQSLAILEYLEEAYPEPPILPTDLYERAYVRRLSQIIGCDIHPLNNVRVLKWLAANVPRRQGARRPLVRALDRRGHSRVRGLPGPARPATAPTASATG